MLCYVVGWGGVQQRSCNLCGRGCNVLAVHYLNKKPGLESVVKALGRFRQLAMKSCRQPTLVFKEAPWDGWNRKNSCLTALGNFDDMQKHWEFPMKNNITSKYLWKHYIIPFSNDLWYITKCAPRNSNGEKEYTKKMLSWSIYDFNFDGREILIRNWKTSNMKWTTSKIYILPAVKHCFFLKFNDPDWRPIGEPTPPTVYVYIYKSHTLIYGACIWSCNCVCIIYI